MNQNIDDDFRPSIIAYFRPAKDAPAFQFITTDGLHQKKKACQ